MTKYPFDIDKFRQGASQVKVIGHHDNIPGRLSLIEEAISIIQRDKEEALKANYLGIKNYASFGDQRADCSYGMSPRHGTIVFSIGLVNPRYPITDVESVLYYLVCELDFSNPYVTGNSYNIRKHNLKEVLTQCDRLSEELVSKLNFIKDSFDTSEESFHNSIYACQE